MKSLLFLLNFVIRFIAIFVFISGVVLTGLGTFDFFHSFSHFTIDATTLGLLAVGLLKAIDLFLMAIVFFMFSIGILVLFSTNGKSESLPQWLRISNFTQLKVILWEAILTTLVISYLAGLVQRRLDGEDPGLTHLIIPGAILLLAISLFFLKKGEH
jgi:uncharacterized membrane protein YqhA